VCGVIIITINARSSQLAMAARLMALNWGFSLQLWLVLDGAALTLAFAVIDLLLAIAFFQMSRRRWFPAPLFFLHAILVVYHLYTALIGPGAYWAQVFLNRVFELEILYIAACAVYRIMLMRNRQPRQS